MNEKLEISFEKERALRIHHIKNDGEGAEGLFLNELESISSDVERTEIYEALQYALNIQYRHAGFSSAAYLTHPLRVACMSITLVKPPAVTTTVMALLHNIFEVSDTRQEEVEKKFGHRVATSLSLLTFDRSQKSDQYNEEYYQKLDASHRSVRLVKILDKLDNLFILGINPDAGIRSSYQRDIERYVIPMVDRELPALSKMIRDLIAENRAIGYFGDSSTEGIFTKT
jgi:(p)ppGpp synthase/HD superfamily hydrolase